MSAPAPSLALEAITHRIFVLHDQKVLLDSDLAALYGVARAGLMSRCGATASASQRISSSNSRARGSPLLRPNLRQQVLRAQDTAGGASCRWPSPSMARSRLPRCSADHHLH